MTCSNLFPYCPQVLIKYQLSGTGDVRRRAPMPVLSWASFYGEIIKRKQVPRLANSGPAPVPSGWVTSTGKGGLWAGLYLYRCSSSLWFVRIATLAPNSWLPERETDIVSWWGFSLVDTEVLAVADLLLKFSDLCAPVLFFLFLTLLWVYS